jgi:hypothetical protein
MVCASDVGVIITDARTGQIAEKSKESVKEFALGFERIESY